MWCTLQIPEQFLGKYFHVVMTQSYFLVQMELHEKDDLLRISEN